jgi:23S rRNA pseudouridine1911/1915/1917 synthase
VVAKPAGVPTVPLAANMDSPSLLAAVAQSYPEVTCQGGRYAHEGMVLHRLDTATSGLVLIARHQKYYQHMVYMQQEGAFWKEYHAAVAPAVTLEGFPEKYPKGLISGRPITVTSFFRPFGERGHAVRPVAEDSSEIAKKKAGNTVYVTTMEYCGENSSGDSIIQCRLNRGFRHQVRAHLAWCGYPIVGDALYGGKRSSSLHLAATALTCFYPETQQMITIRWTNPPIWATISKEREGMYE